MSKVKAFSVLLAVMVSFVGCTTEESSSEVGKGKLEASRVESTVSTDDVESTLDAEEDTTESTSTDISVSSETDKTESNDIVVSGNDLLNAVDFDLSSVPEYSGSPYFVVNENEPFFEIGDFEAESFEFYSELDSLGRCGVTFACVGVDIMPTEERGSIGSVKPSGWQSVKYDCVDGKYLYNRCHLIGYQLTGENANTSNLITGTRSMNVDGMLPFENMVADYVRETENHVALRVTPIFEGDNLLATGVLMEAASIEDDTEGILFNVFVYNAQPSIGIDYSNGDSWFIEEVVTTEPAVTTTEPITEPEVIETEAVVLNEYILNTNSKKIHEPSCSSVDSMSESNKKEYTGTLEELKAMGYEPCKRCNPN